MFTLKAFFGVQIYASFPANVTHPPSYICRHSVVRYRLPTELGGGSNPQVQIYNSDSLNYRFAKRDHVAKPTCMPI